MLLRATVRIIISMMQVQDGLVPTFQISLPDAFMNFLTTVSVWEFDVPLDCFYPTSFHHKLIYKTATPLVVIAILYLVRVSTRDPEIAAKALNWLFFVVFLFYPSCSSIIFRAFSCHEFDDGTKYLRADLSINCGSISHQYITAYAWTMFAIWPVGVPMIYGLVVWHHYRIIRRFQAIETLMKQKKREQTCATVHQKPGCSGSAGPSDVRDAGFALNRVPVRAQLRLRHPLQAVDGGARG